MKTANGHVRGFHRDQSRIMSTRHPETTAAPSLGVPPVARRRFAGTRDQVAAARGFVAALLGSGSDLEETARLLVSEAVTNAVLHSASGEDGGSFEVRCRIARERLRVEVHDGGAPQSPRRRVHQLDALTGRGLELVDALSARWGWSGGTSGRVLWFELELA
jgi:anti-sigma regulatory factor (Ser/Thr protein kinase)